MFVPTFHDRHLSSDAVLSENDHDESRMIAASEMSRFNTRHAGRSINRYLFPENPRVGNTRGKYF